MSGYTPYGYPSYGQAMPYAQPRQEYLPQAPQRSLTASQGMGGGNIQGGFLCRPVTSRAEAEVAQIPFDGTTAWFYDTSADVMYAKTFNFSNGTAPLVAYIRESPAPVIQYATMEDLNALREEIVNAKKAVRKVAKNDDADE